jgi:hypothetical protein
MGKKKPKTVAEQMKDAFEIGLHGTMADLYNADKAALADIEAKKIAHEKYSKRIIGSVPKLERLRRIHRESLSAPYDIHVNLINGAGTAFLQNSPENMQTILSDPKSFSMDEAQSANDFVAQGLIRLTEQMPAPETPRLALTKVDEDQQQRLLDYALYVLFDHRKNYSNTGDYEGIASVLLKNGAKADGRVLAFAIQNFAECSEDSSAIEDLLIKNGASYDAAIIAMRLDPLIYSHGAADRLELAQARKKIAHLEQLNSQLKETISELTGQPVEQEPAQPALTEKDPVQPVPAEKECPQPVPATIIPSINPDRPRFTRTRPITI